MERACSPDPGPTRCRFVRWRGRRHGASSPSRWHRLRAGRCVHWSSEKGGFGGHQAEHRVMGKGVLDPNLLGQGGGTVCVASAVRLGRQDRTGGARERWRAVPGPACKGGVSARSSTPAVPPVDLDARNAGTTQEPARIDEGGWVLGCRAGRRLVHDALSGGPRTGSPHPRPCWPGRPGGNPSAGRCRHRISSVRRKRCFESLSARTLRIAVPRPMGRVVRGGAFSSRGAERRRRATGPPAKGAPKVRGI